MGLQAGSQDSEGASQTTVADTTVCTRTPDGNAALSMNDENSTSSFGLPPEAGKEPENHRVAAAEGKVVSSTHGSVACSAKPAEELHAAPSAEPAAGDIGPATSASVSHLVGEEINSRLTSTRHTTIISTPKLSSTESASASLGVESRSQAEVTHAQVPPARTTIYSRAPAPTATASGGVAGQIESQSRVASTVSGSIAVANSVSHAAGSAATGIANAAAAAARVAMNAAAAAKAVAATDRVGSFGTASTSVYASAQPYTQSSHSTGSVAGAASRQGSQTMTRSWADSSRSSQEAKSQQTAGTAPHSAQGISEGTNAATAATAVTLHDLSGAVHELKQALLCQLDGMTMQLECLRRCDEILALKCSAQADAAAALKTFSQLTRNVGRMSMPAPGSALQDVVQAAKQDDGLVGVQSKLRKLRGALSSIEEQLEHLEESKRALETESSGLPQQD